MHNIQYVIYESNVRARSLKKRRKKGGEASGPTAWPLENGALESRVEDRARARSPELSSSICVAGVGTHEYPDSPPFGSNTELWTERTSERRRIREGKFCFTFQVESVRRAVLRVSGSSYLDLFLSIYYKIEEKKIK